MAKKLLYIISRAPYSSADGQEALEAIMIAASFEQDVSVLFLHDGVFQIKNQQQVKNLQQVEPNNKLKEFTKAFAALDDFGVKNIFCLESSMNARGIDPDELFVNAQLLDESSVSQLIREQNRVFTF